MRGAARTELGRVGEEAALRRYRAAGYRVLARNWKCSIGEIDLVLERGDVLILCEVKTRRGSSFGGPYEAVTLRKQRKLRALGEAFLSSTGVARGKGLRAIRLDVASVTVDRDGRADVHLFEAAF